MHLRAGEVRNPRRLAGLILAAGRSTRMGGGSKLLSEFGGRTVIHRVASTALSARLNPVVVVVGHDAAAVRSALADLAVRFAVVPRSREGRLVSAVTGIEALGADPVAAAMILLGDEPGLTADHVHAVWKEVRAGESEAVRAEYRDRPGHPVVLQDDVLRRVPDLARTQPPETGLWDLIVASGLPHRGVPIEDRAPIDIDTPGDLARAIALRGRNAQSGQDTGHGS